MLLYLYGKNTTDFTNNGTPLHFVFDDHVIRDDGFYLKFKMAIDENQEYKLVKKEMIISALTPDGINQFRIYDITPAHDYVEVVALQLFYNLDHRLVEPFELKQADGVLAIKTFASKFKSGIEPYTFSSDVLEKHDFKTITYEGFEDKTHNALEIANRIVERWDSEFALNGFDVRMTKRLGKRTNALLHEKKNISEFESPISMRNVVTRIYAKSKWTIGYDEEGYVENGDNERELLVTVDSPLINEYSQIYEAEYTNNDCRTEKELINWAKLKYTTDNIDKPKRSIKIETNIIDGEVINYGDDLVLKYLIHDVDEVIRCIGYDFSPVGEVFNNITLGNNLDSFASVMNNVFNEATERQQSRIDSIKKQVNIIQFAANGINRISYGENPVPNPIDGDLWFKFNNDRPNEVRLMIFDGKSGMWVDRTPVPEFIEKEIDTVLDRFDTERTETEQAITDALEDAKTEAERLDKERQTIIDGKFEVVNKANEKLEQSIATAEQNAQDALTKAGASEDLAKTAKEASDNALTQFNTTSKELSEAKATAEETLQNALNALSGANSVITQSQTLLDNAESAKIEATNALIEAQKQLEASGVISGNLTTFKNEVNNAMKGFVTQATYDSNNQTLNTRLNEWEKTANGIKTSISEVEGKVDNLQIGGRNILAHSLMQVNRALTTQDGELSHEPNIVVDALLSHKINVEDNKSITISRKFGTATTRYPSGLADNFRLSFYDANDNPLKDYDVFENGVRLFPVTYEIPSDADYILMSTSRGDLKNLKAEFGNKATDWTLAEEDKVTQSEYAIYKNETEETVKGFTRTVSAYEQDVTGYKNQVASFNQTVDGYKSEVAKQTQTVSGLTTEVANYKQAVDGYSSELSRNTQATNGYKTEVAGYKQTVEGYGSKLAQYTQSNNTLTTKVHDYEATVDGYKQTLTKVEGKVDNLQVGGRNLVLNTQGEHLPKISGTNVYRLPLTNSDDFLGKELTLRFKAKSSNGTNSMYVSIGTGGQTRTNITGDIVIPKEYKEYEYTFTASTSADTTRLMFVAGTTWFPDNNGSITIIDIKLEKGNIATDWTPAPEDLVSKSEYTVYQNEVKSTTDEHTRRLTALDGDGGRVSKVEQTATQIQRSLSDYARTTYVDTKITEKAGEITTNLTRIEGKFDNLQFGGRNYIKDSYDERGDNHGYGITNLVITNPSELANSQVVVSFEAKHNEGNRPIPLHVYYRHKDGSNLGYSYGKGQTTTAEYTKFEIPIDSDKIPSNMDGFINLAIRNGDTSDRWSIRKIKLEKGNKATDWTMAEEDKVTKTEFQTVKESTNLFERTIGTTETGIKSNIAKITMSDSLFQTEVSKNTDLTSTKSKVTQLSNSWALTLKSGNDIKTAINATTDGIRLKGNLITLDGQVNMTSSFIVPEGNIGNLSAKKITSGTIDTARLNSLDIVTKGLTSNVVKSDHILADSALFKKLFTNDLATQNLATKRAWIKSGMIGDAQIGTAQIGQIDASSGKIVNFDARYITANHAELITAGFNGLNSRTTVDGTGINVTNTDGEFISLNNNAELRSKSSDGNYIVLGNGRLQVYNPTQNQGYFGVALSDADGSKKMGVY
ncbi:phage tail spike protein, partial [Globicatella sanguinis]